MSFSLVPRYAFNKFTDISPGFLDKLGVRFLMCDLDNTITASGDNMPTDHITQWVFNMKRNGIELFLVSNNKKKERVKNFADACEIGYIKSARKPSRKGMLQAMETAGFIAAESAMLGDQIFADTLAANRAGIISLIVRPINMKNPLLFLRYMIEAPFRAACSNKMYG